MKNKVLILGKIPPPIGGVTIHVSRLVQDLYERNYNFFDFYNLEKAVVWRLFFQINLYKVVHLHTSSPYLQLVISIFCYFMNKRLIITYHGNWGRFSYLKNFLAGVSSWLAFIPLVQNQESLIKAKKWNNNAMLTSAFIPPANVVPLSQYTFEKLRELRTKYKYLFCTNAWRLTFDKEGNEIYGISSLVSNISKTAHSALIISDPSATYQNYILRTLKVVPENIFFIAEGHDFWNVLKLSDAFVRNTSTDGDSISIHEAIACKITVFSTTCVPRPSECILFNNISEMNFTKELEESKLHVNAFSRLAKPYDTTGELILLYNKCLVVSELG